LPVPKDKEIIVDLYVLNIFDPTRLYLRRYIVTLWANQSEEDGHGSPSILNDKTKKTYAG